MASENQLGGPARALEPLELVHHHPGRLRLRADALIGSGVGKTVADRVRTMLEGSLGVRAVRHNARTGSLLVEYDPHVGDANAIVLRIANAAGLGEPISPREARKLRRSPARTAIDAAREMNALTYELTGWRSDLRFIAPVALAGAAAYSLIRNEPNSRLPKWDTLLWYSYNVFSALHGREIAEAENESIDATRSSSDQSDQEDNE
jgi:hypothetical protein